MDEERLIAKAKREQLRINYNRPSKLNINGKKITIYPITHAPADLMSGYLVKQTPINEKSQVAELIAKQSPNLKLQSKAIAVAILNNPKLGGFLGWFKINMFHWFLWRRIFWTFSSSDTSEILTYIIEKLGLLFFFENMVSTKGMDTLKKKMTREEVELSQAEQESEKKQDS